MHIIGSLRHSLQSSLLICAATLFLTVNLSAQDLLDSVQSTACACLSQVSKNDKPPTIESCFQKALTEYKDELSAIPIPADFYDKSIKNEALQDYLRGEAIGKMIASRLAPKLIHECDAFYQATLLERRKDALNMKYTYDKAKLAFIDLLLSDGETAELLSEKGNYYLVHGDTLNAMALYSKSLKITPDFSSSLYAMAWVYEHKKEYEQALNLYKRLQAQGIEQVQKDIAVVKRKTSEKSKR